MKIKLLYNLLVTLLLVTSCSQNIEKEFNNTLKAYCSTLESEFDKISAERKDLLIIIGDYLRSQIKSNGTTEVIFICQHNSRKSHFAHQWMQTANFFYNFDKIKVYSGATEPSQAHPETVQTLKRAGFKITAMSNKYENPKYLVDRGNAYPKNYMYSKMYNAMENPQNGYCAIMACLNPEECCPVVNGPGRQFTIPYLALEKYDTTNMQQIKYDERCREIAREMFFMVNYITKD